MSDYVRILMGVGLLGVVVASASAVSTIDDFTDGAMDLSVLNSQFRAEGQNDSSTIMGGQRDVLVHQFGANGFGETARFQINPVGGFAKYSSGPGVQAELFLDYDGVEDELSNYGGLVYGPGMNKNFLDNFETALSLTFAYNDQPLNVSIEAYTYVPNSAPKMARVGFVLPASMTSITKELALTYSGPFAWNGNADFRDVDRLVFSFGVDNSNDFALTRIGTPVPEPATMTVVGVGFVALARRRRKRL